MNYNYVIQPTAGLWKIQKSEGLITAEFQLLEATSTWERLNDFHTIRQYHYSLRDFCTWPLRTKPLISTRRKSCYFFTICLENTLWYSLHYTFTLGVSILGLICLKLHLTRLLSTANIINFYRCEVRYGDKVTLQVHQTGQNWLHASFSNSWKKFKFTLL